MGSYELALMKQGTHLVLQLIALFCAGLLFVLDTQDAFAQSSNCRQLARTLASIERNGSFQGLGDIKSQTRKAQNDVQQAESQYVRDGCNAAAKKGEKLNSQCRAEARAVLKARDALAKVSQKSDTGQAVAQQREAVLQEMARFNCSANGSSATVTQQNNGSLFDQLFGNFESDGTVARGDEFAGYAGYNTVRTVCVRKVDGYYWPISYSTLVDYAPNDLASCQESCPGTDVDLYYYSNPGQEPAEMVSLSGEPYKSLPTAFAYRTNYDPANSCKTQSTNGSIALSILPDGTQRAMINFEAEIFPLPLRDPRRSTEVTVVPVASKTFVDIPLPRPRPAAPGEEPKPVVVKQASNAADRIVMFGDKRVRIVGPDTPYAPTAATGT